MFRSFRLLSAFIVGAAVSTPALAAVTVNLTPSTTTIPTSGGTVTFVGSISGDPGDLLAGFDLFFDVAGIDFSVDPSPLTLSNPTRLVPEGAGSQFSASAFLNQGRDVGFSYAAPIQSGSFGSPDILLPVDISNGLDLFSFDVEFAGGLAFGERFEFNANTENNSFFSVALDGDPGDGFIQDERFLDTIVFNRAVVTAVPEPSSMAVLAIVGVAGAYRLRRGRKAAKANA